MKVKELIEKLSKFPDDAKVLITDGFEGVFYDGHYAVTPWEDCVDIGIGGAQVLEDRE